MSDLPLAFYLKKRHSISASVPREKVNDFLQKLWDEFDRKIGRVSCVHKYRPTEDPEVYIYCVDWSEVSQTFYARISFFNNTAKGITRIDISVIDRESKNEDVKIVEEIKLIIFEVQEKITHYEPSVRPTKIVRAKVKTFWKLSGSYKINDMGLYPDPNDPEAKKEGHSFSSYLDIPVCENSPQEILVEALDIARNIASALTLLTQNLFVSEPDGLEIFDVTREDDLERRINECPAGQFVPDGGMIGEWPKLNADGIVDFVNSEEIVEPSDVIIANKIALPKRVGELISIISEDQRLLLSAKRFQEGIIFQSEMIFSSGNSSLGYMLTPYQLVAFVASIEALLDTELKDVPHACKNCGDHVFIKERKIVKSFMQFIENQSGKESKAMKVAFKNAYEDRSKFVHAGKDLYNPSSLKTNRPLTLKGKNYLSVLPSYYYNLPDFTGWVLRRYLYSKLALNM